MNGVWATDSAMTITRNEFEQITNCAIFVVLPKAGAAATPQLGDAARVETTGFNRFREVDGKFIRNGPRKLHLAEVNDWGLYTEADIAAKVSGSVDFYPYLGATLEPGTLAVRLANEVPARPFPQARTRRRGLMESARYRTATRPAGVAAAGC